jgi:hypothetical protein
VIGAVVDADLDVADRWRSLCDALKRAGYEGLPDQPEAAGTIVPPRADLPRIGLWLMPDNRVRGMLEDFLLMLADENDSLLPHAERAVDGLPTDVRRFPPAHRSKAFIHTWLAWQESPGTPLGYALTLRYLSAESPLGLRFRDWLLALFGAP